MKPIFLLALIICVGCDPFCFKKGLSYEEEETKNRAIESGKLAACREQCTTIGVPFKEYAYGSCRCVAPLTNTEMCSKACGYKRMLKVTAEECVCLNPHEKANHTYVNGKQ